MMLCNISSLTAHLVKDDCAISFSPHMERGALHSSQAIESHQLSSVDPDNTEGMSHLKKAEGIAF